MTVTKWNRMSAAAAVLSFVAWGTGQARGESIIPQLESVTLSGSVYTYTYQIDLTTTSEVHSGTQTTGTTLSSTDGSYLGIFDIPGYIVGSEQISVTQPLVTVGGGAWVSTHELQGFQPDPALGVTVTDNPDLYNVNFQYVGTDGGLLGPQTITPNPVLGEISFQSTNAQSVTPNLHYSAEDYNTSSEFEQSNQGLVLGPSASAAPEPATILLLACGAAALVSRRRRAQA